MRSKGNGSIDNLHSSRKQLTRARPHYQLSAATDCLQGPTLHGSHRFVLVLYTASWQGRGRSSTEGELRETRACRACGKSGINLFREPGLRRWIAWAGDSGPRKYWASFRAAWDRIPRKKQDNSQQINAGNSVLISSAIHCGCCPLLY
jgi:hypothetical protein